MSQTNETTELISNSRGGFFLRIGGFTYYKHSSAKGLTKWVCRTTKCYAWARTTGSNIRIEVVRGGPEISIHEHPPNMEEVRALKIKATMRDRARNEPAAPPAQIMRELSEAPSEVLSQLPNRPNLRKMLVRERLKHFPANPVTLQDLEDIPDSFKYTESGIFQT